MEKLIIAAAVTGSAPTKKDNPNTPEFSRIEKVVHATVEVLQKMVRSASSSSR